MDEAASARQGAARGKASGVGAVELPERTATKSAVVDQGEALVRDKVVGGAREGLEVVRAVVRDIAVNVVDVPARWNGEPGSDFINEPVQRDAPEGSGDPDVAIDVGAASDAPTVREVGRRGLRPDLRLTPQS